jgi:hypothetical protein
MIVLILALFFVKGFAEHESVKTLIEKADSEGHSGERVINLFGMSHNSEFYAPGRLVRGPDGKQKMYFSVKDIVDELDSKNESTGLVLVPLQHLYILQRSEFVTMNVVTDNTEFAIVEIKKK